MHRGTQSGSHASLGHLIETLEPRQLLSAPFALSGPGIRSKDFTVTTYATGLSYPTGLRQLPDGSYIVGESVPASNGGSFYNSVGELVRLTTNSNGTAATPQVLYSGLPGIVSQVQVAGGLVFATSDGGPTQISLLKIGRSPSAPLKYLGAIAFNFPSGWMHLTYGMAIQQTSASTYRLFFNVGSQQDAVTTPASDTIPLSGLVTGSCAPDSLYCVGFTTTRRSPVFSGLKEIAYGLRNAAGIISQPGTGNLYFQDNGINANNNPNILPETGADTLDVITSRNIGKRVPDYGFAYEYVQQSDGQTVGSGATPPYLAFLPQNGVYSEGAFDLAFTPAGFPSALQNGMFVGFYGQSTYLQNGETANSEDPIVFVNLQNGSYYHIVPSGLSNIGHPDGLLSTSNALFVSDISANDDFGDSAGATSGNVYEVQYTPRRGARSAAREQVNPALFATPAPAVSSLADDSVTTFLTPDRALWE